MSLSGAPLSTHQTSSWQRRLALLAVVGMVLLVGMIAAGPDPSWVTLLQLGTTGVGLVVAAAYGFHAKIELYEAGLRKVRPLWWDDEIRFADVERALLPMTNAGLLLFTGPGGQPQFEIGGNEFERFDRLVRRVVRCLPEGAVLEDPADRLDEYGDASSDGDRPGKTD